MAANVVYLAPLSALETQFIQSYGEILNAIERHDSGSRSLADRIQALVAFIGDNSLLADRYARATSNESIKEIRRRFPHLDARYGSADYEMITGLFGTMSREEQFSFLTELTVNQKGDVDSSLQVWPLWNTYGETFREIVGIAPIADEWNRVNETIHIQLENIEHLMKIIEATRHELAVRFGEPYEDQSLLLRSSDGRLW